MPKRELKAEEEKRRKDLQSANAPESNTPPSEDAPEQVVTPETEGETLETEGEITDLRRDSLTDAKSKLKKR